MKRSPCPQDRIETPFGVVQFLDPGDYGGVRAGCCAVQLTGRDGKVRQRMMLGAVLCDISRKRLFADIIQWAMKTEYVDIDAAHDG